MSEIQAIRIIVTGRVQGVGFRPFVVRLANELGLFGWVRNCSGQVEIHAEGEASRLYAFRMGLTERAPPLAQPEIPRVSPSVLGGFTHFNIDASRSDGLTDAHIPPDYFVCDDCLAEMQNPAERRFRYPFINCTQCGPRYTIIEGLPYDRPNTSMAGFVLCPECHTEYSDPLDRRYHAQPLACPVCGPELRFRRSGFADQTGNEQALAACIAGLQEGLVIAVKGVGGYHLICDASNSEPVRRLRQRKPRPDKPLALLLPWQGEQGLEWADRLANLQPCEKTLIRSPLRPIVLTEKLDGSVLVDEIAPGLSEVGLMLPYSPLHHLLANGVAKPLVATSANLSGEPVLTEAADVELRLGKVADAFLHHNRPIRRPADDSVYRRIAGKTRPIRLGRGSAPIEHKVPFAFERPLLAVGADLKNTVALGFGNRIVVSPHIGDLGTLRSGQVFEQVISDLQRLFGVTAEAVVCDAHPAYHTQGWAKQSGLPLIPVFHHHAHASALAGEYGIEDNMVVFTWDGTGYGEDGTIWGGETLLGRPGRWQRAGSLKPFHLPGGDKASRQPWRSALALCWEAGQDWPDCPMDSRMLHTAWQKRLNCPQTSSAGRLFDAAAAIIGIKHESSYEGHAAMLLESVSSTAAEGIPLPLCTVDGGLLVSDWSPLLEVIKDKTRALSERASLFHASLALVIAEQSLAFREKYGVKKIGLSGGVFQNRLLTELAQAKLIERGFEVYLHEKLPAGDGGISFGQLIEAGNRKMNG
ncbi:MAG: carbamoyltransferase HypF [Gammaproteobacteria bacterium]